MTVKIECALPDNVVEIGNEVAQGMIDALNAADSPSSSNPLLTKSAGDNNYLNKNGGGTVVGTVIVDTDGTVGGNTATITGTKVEVSNYGVGKVTIDPILGITFPDNTSQGTASVTTPSASTSTAGKVQLATVAEAVAGTDASKAVTAAGVAQEISRRLARRFFQTNQAVLSTQTSGTGAGYTQLQQYTNISGGNAGVAGFARGYVLLTAPYGVGLDYAKPIGFGVWTRAFNSAAYSGTEWRCGIGYTSSPTAGVAVGDLAVRGFGFKWAQGGNVFLQVHDGTTLRNIDTGYTPATTGALPQIYLEAFSDGAGNVTALVRVYPATSGAALTDYTATSANGPTGALAISPNNGFMYQLQTSTTHTQILNGGGLHPTFFYD